MAQLMPTSSAGPLAQPAAGSVRQATPLPRPRAPATAATSAPRTPVWTHGSDAAPTAPGPARPRTPAAAVGSRRLWTALSPGGSRSLTVAGATGGWAGSGSAPTAVSAADPLTAASASVASGSGGEFRPAAGSGDVRGDAAATRDGEESAADSVSSGGGDGNGGGASVSTPRLTSSDLRAFMAAHGLRGEVVSELGPGQLPAGHGVVKSLVLVGAGGGPLVVVVRGEDRVEERRVAEVLQVARRRVRLARPEEVVQLTGYAVGTVPPFGHRQQLRTLVDTAVTRLVQVYGGGGDPDKELSVAVPDLLSYANAIVADVAVATAAASAPPPAAAPAFPLPLPWPAGAQSVELVGVVAQRRRIARLLQFVNLVPEQEVPGLLRDGRAVYLRRLWAHPESGRPVEVQLIMGKTLERNLGREAAQAAMDQVKVGSVLVVTGRVQPHPPTQTRSNPLRATAPAAPAAAATQAATGGPAPREPSAVSPSPATRPPPPQQQQQRLDVLDVVCHSVTVLHRNKDQLHKALRATKRAGLGSPATAAELLRLQQLRGAEKAGRASETDGEMDGETEETEGEMAAAAGGNRAPEVGRELRDGRPSDPRFGALAATAARDEEAAQVEMTGGFPPAVRGPQGLVPAEDPSGGGAVSSAAGAAGGRWGDEGSGEQAEETKEAAGEEAAAGGGEGVTGTDVDAAALVAAVAASTGWRMPLPPSAVRLVCSAAEVLEMQRQVLGPTEEQVEVEVEQEQEQEGDAPAAARPALAPFRVVGLDCEWAPYERHQAKHPVSILQVATRESVYLLDLLRLMAPEPLHDTAPDGARTRLQKSREGEREKGLREPHAGVEDRPAAQASAMTQLEGAATRSGACPAPADGRGLQLSAGALAVSGFLSRLMGSGRVVKLGFQLAGDLDRLCESYPSLPCFAAGHHVSSGRPGRAAAAAAAHAPSSTSSGNEERSAATRLDGSGGGAAAEQAEPHAAECRLCVDVVALARCLRPDLARTPQISLSRLVALVLGEQLDKRQQVSDWARRPLAAEQVVYAATDAYCLVALYDALLGAQNGNSDTRVNDGEAAVMERLERASKVLQVVAPALKRLPLAG